MELCTETFLKCGFMFQCMRSSPQGKNFSCIFSLAEEENFVDMVTTLQLPTIKEEAVWKTAELDGTEVEVQQQTDVGLDFLVDDLHAEEVGVTFVVSTSVGGCFS